MSASHGFVRVLPSSDLIPREGVESEIREVPVGQETVLLGRLKDGRAVAFGTSCPHELTDLHDATFVDGRVRCPRHNYMYNPHSGENVIPARVCRRENLWKLHPGYLTTYAVEEHDGWVWVSATPNPPPDSWDPALEQRPPGGEVGVPTESRPSDEQATPEVPATVEVPPKRLRVRLGKEFELRLPMGAAAHTWKVDVPAAGGLAVVHQGFDPAPPPRQRVRIAARAVGEGTVRCSFGLPWAEPEEVRTYVVEVVPG